MPPKITVISTFYFPNPPTANERHWFRLAVNSILAQTYKDWEHLIINDGSSTTFQDEPCLYDPRIQYIDAERRGRTAALNAGINAARGEYITIQDIDDMADPWRLAKQVAFLDGNPECVLVGAAFDRIDPDGVTLATTRPPTNDKTLRKRLPNGNQFCHSATMYRTDAVKKVGGYRRLFKHSCEYDLWLRLADEGKLANRPDVLCQWRLHPGGVTAASQKSQQLYASIARGLYYQRRETGRDDVDKGVLRPEMVPITCDGRASEFVYYLQVGRTLLMGEKRREASGPLWIAQTYEPLNLTVWFYLAVAYLPEWVFKLLRRIKG